MLRCTREDKDVRSEAHFTCRPGERGHAGRLDPQYAEGAPTPGKMYVSYLQLDKEPPMYAHQSPVSRHPGLSLSPQNFPVPPPPQYSDFSSYHHHHPGLSNDPHPSQQAGPGHGGWSPAYPPPAPTRDDWSSHHYTAGGPPGASSVTGPSLGFSPPDFSGQPSSLLPPSLNATVGQVSPGSPRRRNPYEWIRTSAPPSNPSKNWNLFSRPNFFFFIFISLFILKNPEPLFGAYRTEPPPVRRPQQVRLFFLLYFNNEADMSARRYSNVFAPARRRQIAARAQWLGPQGYFIIKY